MNMSWLIARKNVQILVVMVLSLFLLASCADESNKNNIQDEATDSEADQSREITHAMGTTTIEGTPKKVVTLYQGATDAAISLGIKPVGVVESWAEQPIYDYLEGDLEGVQIVGQETQPNLEEIAKLKPDLIVAAEVRHEEIYEQLSEIAPTVVNENIHLYKESVELIGDATN